LFCKQKIFKFESNKLCILLNFFVKTNLVNSEVEAVDTQKQLSLVTSTSMIRIGQSSEHDRTVGSRLYVWPVATAIVWQKELIAGSCDSQNFDVLIAINVVFEIKV
jgi:hypothetical protein